MRIEPERLFEHMYRESPQEMQQLEALMHHLPGMADVGDRDGDIPEGLWQTLPLGLLNRVNIPAQYGGPVLTATAVRRVAVIERISHVCPGLPIGMPGPGLSTPPVLSLGTEEQKRDYFARFAVADRPVWGAFAITEPSAGSDATAIRTSARVDGDDYVLNGEKCFITCGGRADAVVVFATLDAGKGRFGIRAFVVPKGTPGFQLDRLENMMGLRVSQLSSLSFTDCRVPKELMLGHTGKRGPLIDAFAGAQGAWDYMRPVIAAATLGACMGILDYIESQIDQQALSLTSDEMTVLSDEVQVYRAKIQAGRLLAYRAAWRYDNRIAGSSDASMAKAYASSLAMELAERLCSRLSVHCLVSGERLEKFYRDAKAFDIIEGTGDMQRLLVMRGYRIPTRERQEERAAGRKATAVEAV